MFVDETMTGARTVREAEPRSGHLQTLATVSVCSAEKVITEDEERLRSTIQGARSETVVLDFAQIDSMDSSRLGLLVEVARYATARGTQLKLMNLRPEVSSVLKENNLFSVFEICSPREEVKLWCRAICRRSTPHRDCVSDK
jgi:anti-anti-sigma factor